MQISHYHKKTKNDRNYSVSQTSDHNNQRLLLPSNLAELLLRSISSCISIAKWKLNYKTNSISISDVYKSKSVLIPSLSQAFSGYRKIFREMCSLFNVCDLHETAPLSPHSLQFIVSILCISVQLYAKLTWVALYFQVSEFIGFVEFIWLRFRSRSQGFVMESHMHISRIFDNAITIDTEFGKWIHLLHLWVRPLKWAYYCQRPGERKTKSTI